MSAPKNWDSYPFTVDGVNFVSLIKPNSEMAVKVQLVPTQVFTQMNESSIRDLIGKVSLMSKSEIQDELDAVNLGYSQAYLALA